MAQITPLTKADTITDARAAAAVMMRHGGPGHHEWLILVCLDDAARLVNLQTYTSAAAGHVNGEMRDIIVEALSCSARSVILGHNHPSGDLRPSQADLATTRDLSRLLRLLSIRLQDHIIFSGSSWSSMRALGLI